MKGQRGMDAWHNPDFYRQISHDPERLTAKALELLAKKFKLQRDHGWG